jgi:hypothetical protein
VAPRILVSSQGLSGDTMLAKLWLVPDHPMSELLDLRSWNSRCARRQGKFGDRKVVRGASVASAEPVNRTFCCEGPLIHVVVRLGTEASVLILGNVVLARVDCAPS